MGIDGARMVWLRRSRYFRGMETKFLKSNTTTTSHSLLSDSAQVGH